MQEYKCNGKLLITGEYVVLDGALSLAIPTSFGQKLIVEDSKNTENLIWKSFTNEGKIWFNEELFLSTNDIVAQNLEIILKTAKKFNKEFNWNNKIVKTFLDFPQNWGLGSSSTLIALIAHWARVSPYDLFFEIFSGSGYDIACADSFYPLVYQLDNQRPKSYPVDFYPIFSEKIFFIHLNKKQKSSEGINLYRKNKKSKKAIVSEITQITENMLRNPSFEEFNQLIIRHEELIANCINLPKVKDLYFSDFKGEIKSLGAWGGDFILATGELNQVMDYFISKGFTTILKFDEMIYKKKENF